MKIALIGKPFLYAINRLKEEAEKTGADVSILDINTFSVTINKGEIDILCQGASLFNYDIIIRRFERDRLPYLEYLNKYGVFSYDVPDYAYPIGKCTQALWLASNGILVPDTMYIGRYDGLKNIEELIKNVEFPVVLKEDQGSKGNGVFLCKNIDEIADIMKKKPDEVFILQKMIGNREDLRILVIGDKVLGGMLKKAKGSEFRTNYSQGGSVESYPLNEELADIARRSAKIIGIPFAGVDIMYHEGKPYVLEVNSVPQFEGFEKSTDINVAKALIEEVLLEYSQYKAIS